MTVPIPIEYDTADSSPKAELAFEESIFSNVSPISVAKDSARPLAGPAWLLALVVLVVVSLLGRLAYLQLGQGKSLRILAEGNRLRERVVLAPRGIITDRYGEVLARSQPSFKLVVTPLDVPEGQLESQTAGVVSLLNLDGASAREALKRADPKSLQPLVVASDLSLEQVMLFETRSLEFPGLSIQTAPVREYASSVSFSHVLGITGLVSENDARAQSGAYAPQDVVGKSGLESSYEDWLKGKNGKNFVEVDASGVVVKSLGSLPASPGNSLHLTLDKQLQEELYKQFQALPGIKGAAIALNPKTGEVLALLSYPGFDANLFARGLSNADYQKLTSDPLLPLFNRAIAAQLPPGSTVKPMVGLAGLEEGVITENTVVVDSGKISVPNQFNPSIVYDYVGWKRTGLGPMTVRSAIARSSDIFFYVVGGGHPSSRVGGLGIEKLAEYYRKFHLGEPTGIDIPGEKSGLVADPAWKEKYFAGNAVLGKWYLGDTYHVAIGQGDMLVTPLQVALWTATIANSGVGMKPHIVSEVLDSQGVKLFGGVPEVLIPKVGSDGNIKIIQEGLRQAVLSGSAQQLQALPISSAGKTGTAQFDNNTKTHAWFTAYAPYEDPQIVLTVLVEGGGEGHAVAEPIARDALKWWASHRYQNSE